MDLLLAPITTPPCISQAASATSSLIIHVVVLISLLTNYCTHSQYILIQHLSLCYILGALISFNNCASIFWLSSTTMINLSSIVHSLGWHSNVSNPRHVLTPACNFTITLWGDSQPFLIINHILLPHICLLSFFLFSCKLS